MGRRDARSGTPQAVDDTAELMYADNVGLLEFGPGDREGLAALGRGRCF